MNNFKKRIYFFLENCFFYLDVVKNVNYKFNFIYLFIIFNFIMFNIVILFMYIKEF